MISACACQCVCGTGIHTSIMVFCMLIMVTALGPKVTKNYTNARRLGYTSSALLLKRINQLAIKFARLSRSQTCNRVDNYYRQCMAALRCITAAPR